MGQFVIPLMTGEEPNPQKILKLEENMAQCLDNVQDLWLSQGKYIAGDNITVADIVAASEIEQPRKYLFVETNNIQNRTNLLT